MGLRKRQRAYTCACACTVCLISCKRGCTQYTAHSQSADLITHACACTSTHSLTHSHTNFRCFKHLHTRSLSQDVISTEPSKSADASTVGVSISSPVSFQFVEVCCSVLQCVAECCRVSQCVEVCCNVLECVGVCWSVLECVAVRCSVLQCVAVCGSVLECVGVCCSVLQCVAVCYCVLQCVAVTLQHTATRRATWLLG